MDFSLWSHKWSKEVVADVTELYSTDTVAGYKTRSIIPKNIVALFWPTSCYKRLIKYARIYVLVVHYGSGREMEVDSKLFLCPFLLTFPFCYMSEFHERLLYFKWKSTCLEIVRPHLSWRKYEQLEDYELRWVGT